MPHPRERPAETIILHGKVTAGYIKKIDVIMESGCAVSERADNVSNNLECIYCGGEIWWQWYCVGYFVTVDSKAYGFIGARYCGTVDLK